jgi:tRNA threonylcarbamoyladenosine modification (KEOPS) complex Cgi121 subunit/molybdopterin converting factor small subunit
MITIRLLGGAKKAIGKSAVNVDKSSASVSEILKFLEQISIEPRLLEQSNLIVAINGVDSASLKGQETIANNGDTVTIVTVVHGGGMDFNMADLQISIIGVVEIPMDPGKLIDTVRDNNRNLSIQAVNSGAIYGVDHVLGVIRIVLEAEKRRIMLASKRETELLMRLACTNQISKAIKRAGLKKGMSGCFIALSKDKIQLQQFQRAARNDFGVDDSVLNPNKEKQDRLSGMLGLNFSFDQPKLQQYLIERAAILVK